MIPKATHVSAAAAAAERTAARLESLDLTSVVPTCFLIRRTAAIAVTHAQQVKDAQMVFALEAARQD
jgi:hypothetical protein